MESIGLTAVLNDSNFQAGLKRYTAGIGQMTSATERGANAINALGNVMAGALTVGIGAATVALGAFSTAAKIGLDAALAKGEDLDKLADMFGLTAKQADVFATAFAHFGVPVEEAAYQINFFTRGLAETVKVGKDGKATLTPFGESLKKLGISAYGARGKLKTFDQVLPELMDAFAKLPAGVNKTNLAMELFGARGGSKFLDFLSAGRGALKDATARIEAFGTMTDAQRDAIEEFGFALNDIKDGLQRIWMQIGLKVLPYARKFVEIINRDILPALGKWVRDIMPRIIVKLEEFFKWFARYIVPVLEDFSNVFQDVISLFTDFNTPIGDAQNALQAFAADLATLGNHLGLNGTLIEQFILEIASAISRISSAFQKGGLAGIFSQIATEITNALPAIRAALAPLATQFWNWLTGKGGALEQAASELTKIKSAIEQWIVANTPAWSAWFETWKTTFWNWLTDPSSGLLVTVSQQMEKLAGAIRAWAEDPATIKQMQDIGAKIANDILDGIGKLFEQKENSDNLISILGRSILNAANSMASFFASIGAGIASGIVRGIAERFFGADVARQIANAVYTALVNAITLLIGPGGPVAQLGIRIAQALFDAMRAAWDALFGSWVPSMGAAAGALAGLIPQFQAGGLMPRTGLAYLHAGERVIPAPANINNSRASYTFNHTWNGGAPSDRAGIERMVEEATYRAMTRVVRDA